MLFTYHRVGKMPVLPMLAAAGALVIVGGLAVTALVIVGGIAVTTLVVIGVGASGLRLLRAVGLGAPSRRLPVQEHDTIEGVVVNRADRPVLHD